MATDSIYILNAGVADAERERLDLQHVLYHNILEKHLLPPHIEAELASLPASRPPRVCELATGSAAWLRHLAGTLPASAELVGIDFDTSKFPAPSSSADKDDAAAMPPNVRLLQGDMFGPFAPELQGRFDVVHMRLVVCAARRGTGPRLAAAAASLLRPGGWLVWVDVNEFLTTIQPPSPAYFRFQRHSWAFAVAAGRDLDIPLGIPHFLREAGYTEVESRTHPAAALAYPDADADADPSEIRQRVALGRRMLKRFVGQGVAGMVERGGTEGLRTEADAAALLADLEADLAAADDDEGAGRGLRGLGARLNQIVVRAWGRKPAVPPA